MKLHLPSAVQLVFHRGAKSTGARSFRFEDRSGLVRWVTNDRGIISFTSMKDLEAAKRPLQALVKAWMLATAAPAKVPRRR